MHIHTVRTIVGILGNIFSVGLTVLSKWPRTQEPVDGLSIHDQRSIFGVINCCFWILYTSPRVSPDHTFYLTMNAAVLAVLVGYFAILAWYAPKKGKLWILFAVIMVIILVVTKSLITVYDKPVNKSDNRVSVLSTSGGFILYNYCLTLYLPNLPPLWVFMASMADGCIWTIYSRLPAADIYITVVNGLNMLVGFIGVIMHWWWKPHTARVADSSQGELQNVVVHN